MTFAAKPMAGDRVAVVSPSGGLPEVFPAPYELGIERLRSFGLEPVEYPTTRKLRSTPQERAGDLHAAWADPAIRAVIATIGGDDQLAVLKHLDPAVFRADPKPFFGYSDNTNLLNFLYSLGLPAFHGGSVMVQFGRGGAMHPDSERSLRAALLTSGDFELTTATGWTDRDRDWADVSSLETEPELFSPTDWGWHGPSAPVSGKIWGGCLEIID
jgi:muramoyltetrapeptide carboxypeptidase LdcA involved in peptidoglycan recycling